MTRRVQGFDFTGAVRRICADMTARLPELQHIAVDRVAIGLRRARHREPHGVYATLTPLRFAEGREFETRRGRRYRIGPLVDAAGREYLYLLSFYVPRFLDLPLEGKLSTIVHELWHIGARFDGDLRRHEGRCYAHGPSQRRYDAEMDRLTQRWLAADPPSHLYEFLACNHDELSAEHGGVRGDRWPTPRLAPA
ncbi:MAG TPA: hypothetical protein VEQ85_16150 [Lacipirellulaceae bacterium]|nr:hypothetical protein [Lacipirellulaceae bacterium]